MCFVIQTNYFIIPPQTLFWAWNGKRKESKATVFCGNLIHEECWRWGDGVPSPFALHPLAAAVQVGWGSSSPCRGREGWLVGLETGWLLPGLAQSCLHAWCFGCWYEIILLPIRDSWVVCERASMAAEPCKLLLAIGCKTLEIYSVLVLP